jgi:hypothetical protein
MRKTLSVAALMLALCCPALAGEIPTPPAPQPQGTAVKEPTLTEEDTGVTDTLTQSVLTVLVSLLP